MQSTYPNSRKMKQPPDKQTIPTVQSLSLSSLGDPVLCAMLKNYFQEALLEDFQAKRSFSSKMLYNFIILVRYKYYIKKEYLKHLVPMGKRTGMSTVVQLICQQKFPIQNLTGLLKRL